MPDWAYVNGMGEEDGDPDLDEHHDPAGQCGAGFGAYAKRQEAPQPPEPICKIARENGGKVPLECLFNCERDCHPNDNRRQARPLANGRCSRCGSTSVRWRQQGGKWVLFSLQPGVVHACQIDPSEFRPIKD
jgi:hypothetical protein